MSQRHRFCKQCLSVQRGVAAVEFALIVLFAFFPLLLGIIEFGRFLYLNVTIQEVTRRAAREQIVRWVNQDDAIKRNAVFQTSTSGTVYLPGSTEISNTSISFAFFNTVTDARNNTNSISGIASAYDNANNCISKSPLCIQYVRATLTNATGPVQYVPMIAIFAGNALFTGWNVDLRLSLPGASVIIPAESLGIPG